MLVHTDRAIVLKERGTVDGPRPPLPAEGSLPPATRSRFGAVVPWPSLQVLPAFQYLPVLCLLLVYSLVGNNSFRE